MILNEVIAALDTMFTAAVSPVPVFDVPTPEIVHNARFVAIGSEGEDEDGATVALVPSDLGPGTWLDEAGEILCSAWAQVGGTDLAGTRSNAAADAEACVAAVYADQTLGGLLEGPGEATVSAIRYRSMQTSKGAFCRFTFTVSYGHLNT